MLSMQCGTKRFWKATQVRPGEHGEELEHSFYFARAYLCQSGRHLLIMRQRASYEHAIMLRRQSVSIKLISIRAVRKLFCISL